MKISPLKSFANSKPMEYVCKKYRENNSKFITALSVGSIVAKDGYGCFVYVWQNEHNKNIPEDKKKFISGLDIANGTLMVLAQILAYMTISKRAFQLKVFDKALGKYFTPERYEKIEKTIAKKLNINDKTLIKQEFDKYKGLCKYSDCIHMHEDGCAVLDNIDTIEETRYKSYISFVEEAKEYKERIKYSKIISKGSPILIKLVQKN